MKNEIDMKEEISRARFHANILRMPTPKPEALGPKIRKRLWNGSDVRQSTERKWEPQGKTCSKVWPFRRHSLAAKNSFPQKVAG